MSIPLFRPAVNRRDMQAVLETMVDDTLGPGQISDGFVHALLDVFDFEGGAAFREMRRALDVLFDALKLTEGQGILLSPLLPRVYAEAAAAAHIAFDFVDVDSRNGTVSVESLQQAMAVERDFQVACLVCDSSLGFVPDIASLSELVDVLVLDVSKSCGALRSVCGGAADEQDDQAGESAGEQCETAIVADYVLFSFEEDDIITTGGGAAVLGRSKKQSSALNKAARGFSSAYFLPDINAALGRAQLKELPRRCERRKEIAAVLQRAVQQSRHSLLVQAEGAGRVHYGLPVVIQTGRNDAQQYAAKKGVDTRSAYEGSIIDAYGLEPGQETTASEEDQLVCSTSAVPEAARLWRQTLLFPLYPSLTNLQVQEISRILISLP